MKIIEINNQILQKFRDHHIAMRWYLDAEQYKSSSLSDGWMKNGMILSVNNNIEIEPFCAFYAGVYRSVGIHEMSGLCNMGSFSYSFSALPDGFKVGRYCSIAEGLRFLDGYHPIDRITTEVDPMCWTGNRLS